MRTLYYKIIFNLWQKHQKEKLIPELIAQMVQKPVDLFIERLQLQHENQLQEEIDQLVGLHLNLVHENQLELVQVRDPGQPAETEPDEAGNLLINPKGKGEVAKNQDVGLNVDPLRLIVQSKKSKSSLPILWMLPRSSGM